MAKAEFFVTFERFEPGADDPAESGFITESGTSDTRAPVPLRAALRMVGCVDDCGNGRDLRECDPRRDFRDGTETFRTLHCHNVTRGTLAMIRRILNK